MLDHYLPEKKEDDMEPETWVSLAMAGGALMSAVSSVFVLFYRVKLLENVCREMDRTSKDMVQEMHSMKETQITQGRDLEWIRKELSSR